MRKFDVIGPFVPSMPLPVVRAVCVRVLKLAFCLDPVFVCLFVVAITFAPSNPVCELEV